MQTAAAVLEPVAAAVAWAIKAAPTKKPAKPQPKVTSPGPPAKPGGPGVTRQPAPSLSPGDTNKLLTPPGLPMGPTTPMQPRLPVHGGPGLVGGPTSGIGPLPTRNTNPPPLTGVPVLPPANGIDENDPELQALRRENAMLRARQGQHPTTVAPNPAPPTTPVTPTPDTPNGSVGEEDPWIHKPFHQMLPEKGWHPPLITKKAGMAIYGRGWPDNLNLTGQ